jgi:hypothetical protein
LNGSGREAKRGTLRGNIPWQQLCDCVDRMLSDALEHEAQIRLRMQAIEFARAD